MSPKPSRSSRHIHAAPRAAQTSHPGKANNSAFNTGFREWLRKLTSTPDDADRRDGEQRQLLQLKKMMGDLLGPHVSGFSSRDLRLYLRIVLASRVQSVREMRFECFDLMCRTISEPVAVRQLKELDRLIS